MRIKLARNAFDNNHGLLEHQKLGPGFHIEKLGDFEQERQEASHGYGFCRLTMDRLADCTNSLSESGRVVIGGHVTRLEVNVGNATEITRDETVEDLRQNAAVLLADPTEIGRAPCRGRWAEPGG